MSVPPLNPSCPSGGNWFACTTGSLFVGCCTSTNACGSNGCADGNLKPASFDKDAWSKYPDQSCPSGARWYSCQNNDPPFMGCCKSNPCGSGCNSGDLVVGILNTMNDDGYVAGSMSITSSMSSTSTPASSMTTGTSTNTSPTVGILPTLPSTPTPTPDAPAAPVLSAGAIAGIAIAGAFVIFCLIWLTMCFCRRGAKKSRDSHHLTSAGGHPQIVEPAQYMYNSSKSPGYPSSSQRSPASPYYDSPLAQHPTTPPPIYNQQYAELNGHVAFMGRDTGSALSPESATGLGLRSHQSTVGSVELPGSSPPSRHPQSWER